MRIFTITKLSPGEPTKVTGLSLSTESVLAIRSLLKCGILWSMNPDDDFFQPDINETFQMCNDFYHFTEDEKLRMRVNAWKTRFGHRKPVPADIAYLI